MYVPNVEPFLILDSVEQTGIKRLYYSISEVSNLVDEEQYVLRYWETEFEQLRPQKNRAGNRIYNEKDIEIIRTIQQLLRIKRFTIDGAKEHLKTIQFDTKPAEDVPLQTENGTETPLNGSADNDSMSSIAQNGTTQSHEESATQSLSERLEDVYLHAPEQSSEASIPVVSTEAILSEILPSSDETPQPANAEKYGFSQTIPSEWREPLDSAALLSISTLPQSAAPHEIMQPANEQVGDKRTQNETATDELATSEQARSELAANTLLSAQANIGSSTSAASTLNREELLALRETLQHILRLIEPPESDTSLLLIDTTDTTEPTI
jgi:DNA-binding transcriptional MerR regulator